MAFLTNKALSRRTMLKGHRRERRAAALDSMMPALSAQSKQAPCGWGLSTRARRHPIRSGNRARPAAVNELAGPILQHSQGCDDHFNILTNLRTAKPTARVTAAADHTAPPGPGSRVCMPSDRTRPAPDPPRQPRPTRSRPGTWGRTVGALHRDDARSGDTGGVRFRDCSM